MAPAQLAGGGAARVVAWDQTFAFTVNLGRPEEIVATFKVRNEDGTVVGEVAASLHGLDDAVPREAWLALRSSDLDSDVALDKGFLRVVLLYTCTPRIAFTVREGSGWFGAEHDTARVHVEAISLSAGPGSPRVDAPLQERMDSSHSTREAGALPNPRWEQPFVVAELTPGAQTVLELEGTCGAISLGKARLAFEDLPESARCDATVVAECGVETNVQLRLHGPAGSDPDMVGLASQDFEEAIADLDDAEVAQTLAELGVSDPIATAEARRQRLLMHYGPRSLQLTVSRIVTEDAAEDLPALEHSSSTTPLTRLHAPAHQQRDATGVFVCERLAPITDHDGGVAYAVVKRTALRPNFIDETKTSGGGFVHLTAAGYGKYRRPPHNPHHHTGIQGYL